MTNEEPLRNSVMGSSIGSPPRELRASPCFGESSVRQKLDRSLLKDGIMDLFKIADAYDVVVNEKENLLFKLSTISSEYTGLKKAAHEGAASLQEEIKKVEDMQRERDSALKKLNSVLAERDSARTEHVSAFRERDNALKEVERLKSRIKSKERELNFLAASLKAHIDHRASANTP